MNINDEHFNRYIDGELRWEERDEFEKQLASSPELRKKLEEMKLVHSQLQVMKEDSPSVNFTSIVMNRLSRAAAFRRTQNYFIFTVISVFSILCLTAAGYFLSGIFSSAADSSFSFPDVAGTMDTYVNSFTEKALNIISPKYFSFIGYFAASLLVLAGYMFFENIRNLKKFNK
jgi:hypothetical protein